MKRKTSLPPLSRWHPSVDFDYGIALWGFVEVHPGGGGGVLPKKLGRGVRPASQNPYPIYDQNLRFSLPYLWPDQKFDTLFMTSTLHQYPASDLPYNYFPSSDQC